MAAYLKKPFSHNPLIARKPLIRVRLRSPWQNCMALRQEHRRCTVAPAGLGGKTPWAGLKSVAAVQGTVVRGGKGTTLTRYYITSRTLAADQLLEAVRGHWSIENSVHWVLDVVFGDDYQRLRSDYGPRNMALVQRIALNLIRRRSSGKDSLTVKRKKAGWSIAYLIETIAVVPA